ncbi:putative receptor-like protein kinase At5g59700 [Bidens hawaiensis]|uniref:putative receptor-like protein kinase At5g59700 n=1 Tax=Bidens hawaiensis TaxID=980011 RepID=UPI0040494B7E
MAHMKLFEHLKISLDVIKSATNNFADEIGSGGFGSVYKGKIGNHTEVALKRLNTKFGQGNVEFWKEVMMLSQYKDENIVSLLGFCDDFGERILMYPYAFNGSLDKHLNNKNLRWIGRLKICIGVARGLAYLHRATKEYCIVISRVPISYWMKIGMPRSQILVSRS